VKHIRVTAGLFVAVLKPLAVLGPIAGVAAGLACATGGLSASAMPTRGVEVPFTERVILTAADGARSVFATDVGRAWRSVGPAAGSGPAIG